MQAELADARAQFARVEAEAKASGLENQRIAAEIKALRNDPEIIEKAAREELGLVRQGELILTLDQTSSIRR